MSFNIRVLLLSLLLCVLLVFKQQQQSEASIAVDTQLINQGYTNYYEMFPKLVLYWKPIILSSTTISFAVQGNTAGYVAIGWSDGQMAPANSVIGWFSTSPYIASYKNIGEVKPITPNDALTITDETVTEADGYTTIFFTRPVLSDNFPINTGGETIVIGALGQSDSLEYHNNDRTVVSINFLSNSTPPPTTTATTSNATPPPTKPTPPELTLEPTVSSFPVPISSSTSNYSLSSEGYTLSQVLIREMLTLYWKPLTGEGSISFALQGRTTGFVAVGWSPTGNMAPADSVIGWVITSSSSPGRGDAQVGAYYQSSRTTPDASAKLTISDTAGTEVNGVTTIYFKRPLDSGVFPISEDGYNGIIGSLGDADMLEYHGPHRTDPATKISINFATGTAKVSSNPTVTLRLVHGVLMFVSWGVLIPFGVLFARYCRHVQQPTGLWFHVHRYVQGCSLGLALVGLALAIVMVHPSHFQTLWHGQLGLSIMVVAVLQVLGGLLRPHKDSTPGSGLHRPLPSPARMAFEYLHWWVGRVLVVAGVVNCFAGMVLLESGSQSWMVGIVILAVVTSLYTVVFVVMQVKTTVCEDENVVPLFCPYYEKDDNELDYVQQLT